MTEMKDRIRQIMEAQHMSQQTFANFVGINAASLSSIFNNRTKPTLNTVEAIKSKMPNLNTDWLMFGRGSMFVNDKQPEEDVSADNGEHGSSAHSTGEPHVGDLFGSPSPEDTRNVQHRQSGTSIRPEVRYVERPQRQITEIRVYFDDLTYETFVPKK